MSDTISFYRDAKTGKFITEAEAKERPEGTVRETHTQKSVARMSDELDRIFKRNMRLLNCLASVKLQIDAVRKEMWDLQEQLKEEEPSV